MSEEALLVLKMVQEGKITPEQGVAFLEAMKQSDSKAASGTIPPAPEPRGTAGGPWRTASHAQRVLAQLQQQLAEMQAKLGAAQAGPGMPAGPPSSVKLPFGMGEFNITQILDDTMKSVSVIRNEAVISAKKAARQAQKEARRFRAEAERMGKNIHVEVHVRSDGRPVNVSGMPEANAREESTFDLPDDGSLSIRNPYGDVKITGTSADDRVHTVAENKVWAGSSTEREETLRQIKIEEVFRPSGSGRDLIVTVPSSVGADHVSVNLSVQVPPRTRIEAATTFGSVHCESIEGGVSRVETENGDVRLLHIHISATASNPESVVHTHSGSVSVSQWRAGALTIESASGEIQLDTIDCPTLTVHAANGDVLMRAINGDGDLRAEGLSGDLQIEDVATPGGVSFKTHSGDMALKRIVAGSVALDTVSGDITADDAICGTGRAVMKAISGDIQATGMMAGDLSLNTTSGDANIAVAPTFAGSIACATVSGDVSLVLPAGLNSRLTMTTHSGNLKCDFGLSSQEGDGEHYLNGIIGDPTAAPRSTMLQSVSGDLEVKPAA